MSLSNQSRLEIERAALKRIKAAEEKSPFKTGNWMAPDGQGGEKMVEVTVTFYPEIKWWATDRTKFGGPLDPSTRRKLTLEEWQTFRSWL